MKNYPNLNKAIAKVLYQRRLELELSKKKLSERASITRIHISDLEGGSKNPTMNAVFFLCDALELDPKEFITRVQKEIKKIEEGIETENAESQK